MVERRKTRCRFCSLGCGCFIETVSGEPVGLEYDRRDPVGGGSLCAKGNYMLELIDHPMRLTEPEWEGVKSSWGDVLARIAGELADGFPERTGMIVDGLASAEDIGLARAFADQCARDCVVGVHIPTGEDRVSAVLSEMLDAARYATLDDVAASDCTLAVGDPFAVGPVIAGRVLDARYRKRGNLFAAIAETENMTTHLSNAPMIGRERDLMLMFLRAVSDLRQGDDRIDGISQLVEPVDNRMIRLAAQKFIETPSAVLLLQTGDPVIARLAAMVVLAAGDDKRLYLLTEYANAAVAGGLDGLTPVESIIESAASGKIDMLMILGSDILGGLSAEKRNMIAQHVELLIAGSPFESDTTRHAHAILPTAIWSEYDGAYAGESQEAAVMPPGAALSYGKVLSGITAAMHRRLVPAAPSKKPVKPIEAEQVLRLIGVAKSAVPQRHTEASALSFADGFLTGQTRWVSRLAEVRA